MREYKTKMYARRHYETIAYALARARPNKSTATQEEYAQWSYIVYHMKLMLSQHGKSFDAVKFEKATLQEFG